jgi:type I restriction enzyme, R subunit
MDYYEKFQGIVAAYNREKDRATAEAAFQQPLPLAANLDAEQKRAAEEGLIEDELAFLDPLFKDPITKTDVVTEVAVTSPPVR